VDEFGQKEMHKQNNSNLVALFNDIFLLAVQTDADCDTKYSFRRVVKLETTLAIQRSKNIQALITSGFRKGRMSQRKAQMKSFISSLIRHESREETVEENEDIAQEAKRMVLVAEPDVIITLTFDDESTADRWFTEVQIQVDRDLFNYCE
jgi:hypothetical protein